MPDPSTPQAPVPKDNASDSDAVLAVAIGTALWAIALVILVVLRDQLQASGTQWWIGVAVVGLITGILATAFFVRRRRRR